MSHPVSQVPISDITVAVSAVRWIFPVGIAVVVVAVLIGLLWWDTRRRSRARQQGPRAERSPRSQRTLREADDFGDGLSPYELNRPSSPRDARKDDSGGAFGSGGPGG
ncbi:MULTISPECIES: DUF6479 family protein [unclassified Streptomyces]|uniref:DUF6479 family protein n=1 Tax=unclassified Streptomyces TaxID=2593676 RepID=UPI00338EEA55